MAEEEQKQGYYTVIYKRRLYTEYLEYFKLTNQKFNELVLKYYNLLFKYQEFLKESSRNCRTKLENITCINKYGEIPKEYFKCDVPSRFRRSAMMQAIGQAKAYFTNLEKSVDSSKNNKLPSIAKEFNFPTTYYQEMYQYLEDRKIKFKLYNGTDWKWYEAKFSKWDIPENAELLSPKIKVEKKFVLVDIPVRCTVENLTTIKERMEDKNTRVCGVAFSGKNNIATCVVVDINGKFVKTLFISGGDEYKYLTSQAMRKIQRNTHIAKNSNKVKGSNKKYWKKISKYTTHFSHVISRNIVDFCVENEVTIIALSNVRSDKIFLKYSKRFNPATLRDRITNYVRYKAFKENILVTFVDMTEKTDKCYKCGEVMERKIRKQTNKKIIEDKAICKNGHQADYFFNCAMNIALGCLRKYDKKI